jgi:nitrogen regulatory protein PII
VYHLVIFVLDDPDHCHNVLDAWESAGVTGVTILESSGLGRMRRMGMLDNIPMMPSLEDILKTSEERHRTLFAVVKDQQQIDAIVAATESIVGDLDEENTGLLFVLPVSQVYGQRKVK